MAFSCPVAISFVDSFSQCKKLFKIAYLKSWPVRWRCVSYKNPYICANLCLLNVAQIAANVRKRKVITNGTRNALPNRKLVAEHVLATFARKIHFQTESLSLKTCWLPSPAPRPTPRNENERSEFVERTKRARRQDDSEAQLLNNLYMFKRPRSNRHAGKSHMQE